MRIETSPSELPNQPLAVEPAEAEQVRWISDWYLRRNMGVVAISRELNRLGIKPRKAERWRRGPGFAR